MPPTKRRSGDDVGQKSKRGRKKASVANGGACDTVCEDASDEHNEPAAAGVESNDDGDVSDSDVILPASTLSCDLLLCGGTNWDLIGRKQLPKGVKNIGGRNLWGPHRVVLPSGVKVRTIVSGCTSCHSIIITTEGKAFSWGRNDKGQLGHGDTERRNVPTLVEGLSPFNIVAAACGKGHTICLTDRGVVYSFGDNKMAQLGLGYQTPFLPSPSKIKYTGAAIQRVACGGEYSVLVDCDGHVLTFGCPEYGQLGHNTDGQFTVSGKKMTSTCEAVPRRVRSFIEKNREGHVTHVSDICITEVACGINHTVALDDKKRVFTWGFGGYGRLGHAEPKSEWVPRMVKFFEGPSRGARRLAAGSTFTLIINEHGVLYLWGQTKSTGDAIMYPKPVQDLGGWKVRSIGCCNKSIVVAADDSVVSWGPSPTYGELGYGDNKPKSSTVPQEMKALQGVYVEQVACGYGHTLMMARTESEEDRQLVEQLPTLDV